MNTMPMIKDVVDARSAGCIRHFYYDNKTNKNLNEADVQLLCNQSRTFSF